MKIIINQGREILLLGSVRESIMTPSETSSEKNKLITYKIHNHKSEIKSVRIELTQAKTCLSYLSLSFMAYFDERFFLIIR
jgi:hypothetical protein